jgi:replication factor C large subunit
LFFKGKIILVDEIDGVSGQEDRGGVSAIAELIQESGFPIVMTANDPFDKKFAPIRKKAELLEFHALNYLSIYNVLKSIAKKEKIEYDDEALKCLARSVGGDLRAAINDLQTLSNEKRLTKEDLASLSEREQRESIMQALLKVFKTTDPNIAKYAYKDIAEDLDELFMWVDENLPKEYLKPEDLSKAMSNLALADVYKGRIRRWQYYRFYVYCYDLLSVGIALSKDEKYKHFVNYTPTTRILKMWQANMKNMKKKAIAEKIASGTHTSTKRAMRDTIPYLQVLFKRGFRESKAIAEEYDLSKEEVEWLRK